MVKEGINQVAIYDYVNGIEEEIIFLEKLIESCDYESRCNLSDNKEKTKLFLRKSNKVINQSLNRITDFTSWIKEELKKDTTDSIIKRDGVYSYNPSTNEILYKLETVCKCNTEVVGLLNELQDEIIRLNDTCRKYEEEKETIYEKMEGMVSDLDYEKARYKALCKYVSLTDEDKLDIKLTFDKGRVL